MNRPPAGGAKLSSSHGVAKAGHAKTAKASHAQATRGPPPPPGEASAAHVKPRGKTAAQIRFEEASAERRRKEAARTGYKSHKAKVAEFNEKLGKLSEHHDIPKVGPG